MSSQDDVIVSINTKILEAQANFQIIKESLETVRDILQDFLSRINKLEIELGIHNEHKIISSD